MNAFLSTRCGESVVVGLGIGPVLWLTPQVVHCLWALQGQAAQALELTAAVGHAPAPLPPAVHSSTRAQSPPGLTQAQAPHYPLATGNMHVPLHPGNPAVNGDPSTQS